MRCFVVEIAAIATLLFAGCSPHSETVSSRSYTVEVPAADAGCPPADASLASRSVPCSTNEDCFPHFAPLAAAGTFYVVCFYGECVSAESCTITHAGAPDHCSCGSVFNTQPCGVAGVCARQAGEDAPSCTSRCDP